MKLKILNDHKGYWCESSESVELDLLYLFLTQLYPSISLELPNWLYKPNPDFISGNAISISFYPDTNSFEIEDIVFYEEENILSISAKELTRVVNKWEELLKQKPDEIIITQDKNKFFNLTGKFADGREI